LSIVIPELFEGLVIAFNGLSEDPSVRVGHDGTIVFTKKLKIGTHEKVLNLPIPLKLVEMDAMKLLKKQIRSLFRER